MHDSPCGERGVQVGNDPNDVQQTCQELEDEVGDSDPQACKKSRSRGHSSKNKDIKSEPPGGIG